LSIKLITGNKTAFWTVEHFLQYIPKAEKPQAVKTAFLRGTLICTKQPLKLFFICFSVDNWLFYYNIS